MDWSRKNCTVHLHYFSKRIRQNCQNSHFPFLLPVSFFKFLNLENRWWDDITWLLSTILMKHHRGEYFGKISHPHRVWKVYTQRFSEITKGISHMENHNKYARCDWRENWRNVAEKLAIHSHKQICTAHKLETCCGGTADSEAIAFNTLDQQRYEILVCTCTEMYSRWFVRLLWG